MNIETVTILLGMVASVSTYFTEESFTIILSPTEEVCFSKTFTKSIKVIFEYSVTEGGNKDIDTKIVSPNGMIFYKELKGQGDEVSFNGQNGDFRFCFSNEFSRFSSKRIAFSIRPFQQSSLSERIGQKSPTVNGPHETYCDDIYNLMTSVHDFQMKFRVHESMGRYVAESLNKQVMWWSLLQALFIMVTGFGQVFILKLFFTDHRPSSKPLDLSNPVIIS